MLQYSSLAFGVYRGRFSKAFPFGRGSWQIVGGIGAYADIAGNGAEFFPSATEDILSGIIY